MIIGIYLGMSEWIAIQSYHNDFLSNYNNYHHHNAYF